MGLLGKHKIAIDLGSEQTIIYIDRKGIALREPSVLALESDTGKVVAFGHEALDLDGRTSDRCQVIYPIQHGRIHNYSAAKQLLNHFIKKGLHQVGPRPDVALAIPSGLTKVDRKAFERLLKDIDITRAMILEAPLAGAIGANLDVEQAKGRLILDIGKSKMNAAVISYGEIISTETSDFGSEMIDQGIIDQVRRTYQIKISPASAEELKKEIAYAVLTDSDRSASLRVNGINLANDLPIDMSVQAQDLQAPVETFITELIQVIRRTLSRVSPELAADILDGGMLVIGGGSLLKRLPERLNHDLGLIAHLSTSPFDSIILGSGKLLKGMDKQTKQAEQRYR